jgi:two-component system, LytTR family, response regulator
MIRSIIVDDEPLAREKVHLFSRDIPNLEVVDICSNGFEAINSYKRFNPDLLFLDIQMPEMTGFGVLEELKSNNIPAVIFITAYDEYALRAFEFHALDYLLKPYDRERFNKAVAHAKAVLESSPDKEITNEQIRLLLETVKKGSIHLDRIVVKTNGRIIFLRGDEIDWMEAAGNYIKLHCGNDSHLVRETMSNMEQQLHPEKFIRIHRSTIINVDKLKELQPWFNGDYKVFLTNNVQLILSKNYREQLMKRLGRHI